MMRRMFSAGYVAALALTMVENCPPSYAEDHARPTRYAQSDDPFKKAIEEGGSSAEQPESGSSDYQPPQAGARADGDDPILDDIDGNTPGGPSESGSTASGSTETASPGTTDVEAGTASDSKGETKVIYQKDKNGRTVGVTYVHYNDKGEIIGRDHYDIDPNSPDGESGNPLPPDDEDTATVPPVDEEEVSVEDDYRDPAPVPDGTFAGDFAGDAAGEIRFTVNGNVIQGSMRGRYSNAPFRVQFRGTINENGAFTASASGTTHTTIENVEGDYPVGGTIEGNVANRSARGYWSGKASTMMSNAKGTWSASQYP